MMEKLGKLVGRLHEADITHGDLTTSNVVVEPSATLTLLDIGLGEKTKEREKKAVDLVVLMRVLESDHHKRAAKLWRAFLRGYRSVYKDADELVKRAKRIKSMGRYFEVRGRIESS
jgi:Kae1-associated kinase Bud32